MLTQTEILDMAGDDLAKANAEALAKPHRWYLFAREGNTFWGIHKQPAENKVVIDTETNTFFCTCKKERCRHVLGLYLLCFLHGNVAVQRFLPEDIKKLIKNPN